MTYDDSHIAEFSAAKLDISVAFHQTYEIFENAFPESDKGEIIILTEYTILTHILDASKVKKPGINDMLITLPLFWIRLHADFLRRWFQYILCQLIPNAYIVPPGTSIKQFNDEQAFRHGISILNGISIYDRNLIKNLVYQANDNIVEQNGEQNGKENEEENNYRHTFCLNAVIDNNPTPFRAREHTVSIELYRYSHDLSISFEVLSNAKNCMAKICKEHLHEMMIDELVRDNPATGLIKVTHVFEMLTNILAKAGALSKEQTDAAMKHCRKTEFHRRNSICYDARFETLLLTSVWISGNAHRFEDNYFPLDEIAMFINKERNWTKPINETRLSRILHEENLRLERDRRDIYYSLENNPDNTSTLVGTEGSPVDEHAEVDKEEDLKIRKRYEIIPFLEDRHQVTHVLIDIPKLQKLTENGY